MAVEIERKFLLKSEAWRKEASPGLPMVQGYLAAQGATVRVRIAGEHAFLTIKGRPVGLVRHEFEYPIPLADAKTMLAEISVGYKIEKIRYRVPAGDGLFWEIDEYLRENAPLFTAEIELPTPETAFVIPSWLGEEVTGDGRYTNRSLSRLPYSQWTTAPAQEGK